MPFCFAGNASSAGTGTVCAGVRSSRSTAKWTRRLSFAAFRTLAPADPARRGPRAGLCSAQPATMSPGPRVGAARLLLSPRSVCRRPGPGIFPAALPSALPPSLQVWSGVSPRGAVPGGCGVFVLTSPCHGGALLPGGAEAEGWGSRRTAVPGSSPKGSHRAGLCREPEAALLAGSRL